MKVELSSKDEQSHTEIEQKSLGNMALKYFPPKVEILHGIASISLLRPKRVREVEGSKVEGEKKYRIEAGASVGFLKLM